MTKPNADDLVEAINAHGDQLGGNLVHFKKFLNGQRERQEAFLAAQQEQNSRLQEKALSATRWAAFAAGLAALATVGIAIQAF